MRLFASVLLCALASLACAGQEMQRAQDRADFAKARAVTDPEQRLAALKVFAAQYRGTPLARRASALELETLLRSFPDRTAEIHPLAAEAVAAVPAGFERWSEKARVADLLASAGTAGADLPAAEAWAKEAVTAMTEESYRREMRAVELRYKLPALRPAQRHREFARTRASFLAALANVQLREHDAEAAGRLLAEAERLDPLSSEVSSLKGQLALTGHREDEALADFEQAEAEGDLKEPWRSTMVRLYLQTQHRGEEAPTAPGAEPITAMPAGLGQAIDRLYGQLFPPPYALAPRRLPAGGHTVLLELFTGSGCEPCVAPDLAVESLLGTYSPEDLVVLEYDEHIPRPDPLANPDSVGRAGTYRVGTTPEAFLDGEELPVVGASRSDVENVVVSFADAVEEQASTPPGVGLALRVQRGERGILQATADLSPQVPVAAGRALPRRTLVHLALVEDHVRYSGENGIRFHRMVVRALSQASGPDLTKITAGSPVSASFDPREIANHQRLYLEAFEKSNDRFGEVQFRTKDIPMQPDQLGVVAWVEDPATHEVLQAIYQPVRER